MTTGIGSKEEKLLSPIIEARPALEVLDTESSIAKIFGPALSWVPDLDIFTGAGLLRSLIVRQAIDIYGNSIGEMVEEQLLGGNTVETGAHLHIPRRFDRNGTPSGPQMNSLVTQGQVTWSSLNADRGNHLSISMSPGRVPLNNINSGAYIDLPSLSPKDIQRLLPSRYKNTPQLFVPPVTEEQIDQVRRRLETWLGQEIISKDEYEDIISDKSPITKIIEKSIHADDIIPEDSKSSLINAFKGAIRN
ncbi:hypothetical protein LCGC14_2899430, partial [marine sediment metagenome]